MVYNEKLFDVFIFARVFFALCNGKNKKKMPLSVYYVWLARLEFYLMCNYSMTVIIRGRIGEFFLPSPAYKVESSSYMHLFFFLNCIT